MSLTITPGQRVARNSLYLLIAQISARALGFVPVLLLTHYFGAEAYGLYTFALAFAMLFSPLCDLGVDTLIVREVAARPADKDQIARNALGLKVIFGVVTLGLIAIAAILEGTDAHIEILVLAGVVVVLRIYPMTVNALFRGIQRMELDAFLTILYRILEVVAALLTTMLSLTLKTFFLMLIGGAAVSVLMSVLMATQNGIATLPSLNRKTARSLLWGGVPFVLTGVFVTLHFQMGTILLGTLLDTEAVGIYRSAYNLVFPMLGTSAALAYSIYPAVSELHLSNRAESVQLVKKVLTYSALIGFPIASGSTALAGGIIDTFYPSEFAGAADVLRILAWWIPIAFMSTNLGFVLAAIRRQPIVLAVSIVNAAVNIFLTIYLVPQWGMGAAAWATVIAETGGLLLCSLVVWKVFGNVFDLKKVGLVIVAASLILPLAALTSSVPLVPLILAGGVLYGVSVYIFGIISIEDLRRIRSVFTRPRSDDRS